MYQLSRGSRTRAVNIWPAFVDGLSTLVLVVMFVLMVFMVAQYFLSAALTGKDERLATLDRQIAELSDLLSLERNANAELRINVAQLSSELQSSLAARDRLQSDLGEAANARDRLSAQLASLVAEQQRLKSQLSQAGTAESDLQARLKDAEARAAKVEADLEDAFKVIEVDKEKIETQLAELAILRSLRQQYEADIAARDDKADELARRLAEAEARAREQVDLSDEATRKVDLLNRQLLALREQISALSAALDISEKENREKAAEIADLGRRLNIALASKVQELARYRSEFFGRLREVLGDNPNIRIVGDRFVFQSEVLFPTASAELEPEGRARIAELATLLKDLAKRIPEDIDWVLRVDGHTDRRPISTPEFPSNWELSAARAIAVVKFLLEQGVPPGRLVAAGFGEYQPIDKGTGEEAFARNRRIEFKLTER